MKKIKKRKKDKPKPRKVLTPLGAALWGAWMTRPLQLRRSNGEEKH